MIPLGKLVALAYLLITVQRGSIKSNHERTRLYRLVEFIGRWSMLDVFVDAFIVALVQLHPLMSVEPGLGRDVLHGGGRADDDRGPVVRSAPDLGPRRDHPERAWLSPPTTSNCRRPRWCGRSAAGSRSSGSSRSSPRWWRIGIAVQRIRSEGPTITIVFKAAEGIEAGKTFIKYKDVNIGQVTAVQLTEDYQKVEVTAKIAKSAAGLMVEDAKFWVVRPASASERGLRTQHAALGQLHRLRGRHVGRRGHAISSGSRRRRSSRASRARVHAEGGRPGLARGRLAGLLPRLPVGQVVAYDLAPDGKSVDIQVFVNAPYDKFVSPGTRFWNASGIDVSVDANGVDVRTESLGRCSRAASRSTRRRSSTTRPSRRPTRSSRSTATGPPR